MGNGAQIDKLQLTAHRHTTRQARDLNAAFFQSVPLPRDMEVSVIA